jgi:hypothetical protein
VATFTFTPNSAGDFTLVVKGASGAVISTQTIQVLGVGAASGHVTGGRLARTGFDSTHLVVGGGVLVLVGAGAVRIARRRRSAQVPAGSRRTRTTGQGLCAQARGPWFFVALLQP